MNERGMCQGLVNGVDGPRPCSNTAKAGFEGKWYCLTHHKPSMDFREEQKALAKQQKWRDVTSRQIEQSLAREALRIVRRIADASGSELGPKLQATHRDAVKLISVLDVKLAALKR